MINIDYSIKVFYETKKPDLSTLIQFLRHRAYRISTVMAYIVDNALTTNAPHMSIYVSTDADHTAMADFDDGEGMSTNELLEEMRTEIQPKRDTSMILGGG